MFFSFFWGGVPSAGLLDMIDTNGALITLTYSSNLAFTLAPGWLFVESEDWCGGGFRYVVLSVSSLFLWC